MRCRIFVFASAGAAKLATPHTKLVQNPRMGWAEGSSPTQVKGIGAVEVLGAVGLVLPWLLNIAHVLTPVAALGLAALLVGAAAAHGRRGELRQAVPVNGALFVLAIAVAVIRFTQL